MHKLGLADTMFARGDMAKIALKAIRESKFKVHVERYTVPGIKDLPVACKKLIEEKGCHLVLAFGMAGGKPIDTQCAHEASLGIQMVQLLTNTHVLEVFVHENEASSDQKLAVIMRNRAYKHTVNALQLLHAPQSLSKKAGTAQRQGGKNAKALRL